MNFVPKALVVLGVVTSIIVHNGGGPVTGQVMDLAIIVDSFYPQDLTEIALEGGAAAVREQCFAVLESDSVGRPRVVVAAYTNRTIGAVRVLTAGDSGFHLAAEPLDEDHAGWTCEVRRVDVDNDGRSEAHVKFLTRDGSTDWVYAWDGQQILNLTPTTTSPRDGALESSLINARFVDTDGDRIPEIYTFSKHRGGEAPFAPKIYRFAAGRYVLDRPVAAAYAFQRSDGTPTTDTVDIQLPRGAQGPFRLRVFNGTDNGARVENAVESGRVWFNSQEIVSPNDFGNHVAVIERTVNLQAQNELKVRLAGAPGGRITVVIDAASWTP